MSEQDNTEIVENEILDIEENVQDEEGLEESAASDTLKPNPTKSEMLATMSALMASLGKEDLSKFFNDSIAQIGKEAEKTPSATAPGKTGLGQMGMPKLAVKEDVEEMFSGEDLTEDFKDRASTLFEAAVEARVILEKTRLEEEAAALIEEKVAEVSEAMTEKLDQYLEYVVEQWAEDNKIAIESSLRGQIAEEFMGNLYNLFNESYINVPEDKIDVLGELQMKIEELEGKLDESVNKNIEFQSMVDEANKEATFDDMCEGLAATQVEKFRTLAEGVEYSDIDTYAKKLNIIKEKYFGDKSVKTTNIITEDADEGIETAAPVPAGMSQYVNAISRTLK